MDYDPESVIGFDALYNSMWKCKKGVVWKDSVAAYFHRGIERTARLSQELRDGTYRAAPTKHFTIMYPKPREIASVAFRDRVYQRSLNDNVVYPAMTKSFIYDNFACQKGKGTDAARERLKQFLREHYRRNGADGFVAQFDIHGYYPNMRHDVAEKIFQRNLPAWAFERVRDILRGQYEGDHGYNPGSQLVQIAGISVLNPLDHYIKERLRVHHYIRYMDDLILLHPDQDFLQRCYQEISAQLAGIGFEVNAKKTRIYPLSEGIPFLGFRFTLTGTGKVLMQINPERVRAQRRKLRRLAKKAKAGGIPRENVDMAYAAWRNHASKGNSYHLLQRMDQFYRDLWKGENPNAENHQAPNDAR